MRSVEDTHLAEQDDGYPASLTLGDFRTEVDEERFNISPGDIGARWVRKHQLQRFLALPFHESIVPLIGTIRN